MEQNEVSMHEVDAFNSVGGNYLNWAAKIVDGSSFFKDGWFTSALVAPPMLELAHEFESLQRVYVFNRYAC